MLGGVEWDTNAAYESFEESPEDGGRPFCISFHKSEDYPWDYSCDKNDADHFKDFIPWILGEFPAIDPEAVFLHGFSSGAIMTSTLMFASCGIERHIAGAAPYAGLIGSPPTTKAALLIPHGTHDNVVPYREDWIGAGVATPSCECNGLAGGQASCFFDDNWISMVGPVLASGIAILRGYEGTAGGAGKVPGRQNRSIDPSIDRPSVRPAHPFVVCTNTHTHTHRSFTSRDRLTTSLSLSPFLTLSQTHKRDTNATQTHSLVRRRTRLLQVVCGGRISTSCRCPG